MNQAINSYYLVIPPTQVPNQCSIRHKSRWWMFPPGEGEEGNLAFVTLRLLYFMVSLPKPEDSTEKIEILAGAEINVLLWLTLLSLSILTCFLAVSCPFCHSCFNLPPNLSPAIQCLSSVHVSLTPQRSNPIVQMKPIKTFSVPASLQHRI